MGGVFFCKKWTFPPQNETKLMLDLFFYFTFYLFGGGGVRTHPTHPLPTGLYPRLLCCQRLTLC